jgi:hypothetical protein
MDNSLYYMDLANLRTSVLRLYFMNFTMSKKEFSGRVNLTSLVLDTVISMMNPVYS